MDDPRKTCAVCNHPESKKINMALAQRVAHKKIADQYGFSYRSIHRHAAQCVEGNVAAHALLKKAESAFDYGSELLKRYRKVERLADAFEESLADPEDPTKLFLGPQGTEMHIVYDDWNDLNEKGNPTRKKAILQELLRIINGSRREVIAVNSLVTDNRKLYLDCFRAVASSLQELGKFLGLWKGEAPKDPDAELDTLREIIQASADENGITFDEEARIMFSLPIGQTIRQDIKAKLISDLEQ